MPVIVSDQRLSATDHPELRFQPTRIEEKPVEAIALVRRSQVIGEVQIEIAPRQHIGHFWRAAIVYSSQQSLGLSDKFIFSSLFLKKMT